MKHFRQYLICALVTLLGLPSFAQELPAPASKLSRAEASAPNRQPSIPRPEQDAEALEKLEAFEARSGQKPNILIFIFDGFFS